MIAKMLICENPACRFLIDLRELGQTVKRSSLIINFCPECNSAWSDSCPFCSKALDVTWKELRPRCAICNHALCPVQPPQT